MSNFQAITEAEIKQFIGGLSSSAKRIKASKILTYQRRKQKTWAEILDMIKAETSDEQEIRQTRDEDMRVSSDDSGESTAQQEIPQSDHEPMEVSPEKVESVEQRTSQKLADPLPMVMTGTDGGSRGIVLDRAHLFTAHRPNGLLGVKSRSAKNGESREQKEIRPKVDEPARVSQDLCESTVLSENRPTAHEPMQVSPVTYSFKFTPPTSAVPLENGESLSVQDTRQKLDDSKRVSDSVSGESLPLPGTRQKPSEPARVSPESGESLSESATRQKLDDSKRVSDSVNGESPKQKEIRHKLGWDFAPLPYWVVALTCTTWLVHSMAQGLGGGFWHYCIAIAFDLTPVLLVGARVSNPRTQQTAMIGAVVIFLAGLALYLAPHVQTLSNELSVYNAKSARYVSDLADYEKKSANKQSLVDEAKKKYDDADADYKAKLDQYGEKNWRTGTAKQKMDKLYTDWKAQSQESETLVKPEAPIYTDNLRAAAQELIMRLGLFAACFLLMFVMRRLDPAPKAA